MVKITLNISKFSEWDEQLQTAMTKNRNFNNNWEETTTKDPANIIQIVILIPLETMPESQEKSFWHNTTSCLTNTGEQGTSMLWIPKAGDGSWKPFTGPNLHLK